jgi:glycosyltransferase involved in cell wall biosynthesis
MHVGLNLVFLVPGETGGMEVYARELIQQLVSVAPQTRFTAFINREAAAADTGPWGDMIPALTVPVRARNRLEWVRGEQQLLPRLAMRASVDVLHSLGSTAPAWGRFRRVTTIHDLNYRIVPEAHLGIRGLGMRLLVPLAARRSHRIIVPTRSTRDDLRRLLGVSDTKVDVVYEGVGVTRRVAPLPEPEVRSWLAANSRPIALTVAAKRPHKNLIRLLDALSLIAAARRPLLVLAGYHTQYETELHARVADLGIADSVRILGWISESQLEGLYAAAACFVFPSLYEGFGLPVLEAMARGLPVACSGRGALEEVAGDAALRFDPEDPASIAAGIERLVDDPAEADRLRAAGRARALRFSWASTAAESLAVYERALADSPTRNR